MFLDASIRFVNLGLEIEHLGSSIKIGDFEIAYYGIIIAVGMLLAIFMTLNTAKMTGQNPDEYYELGIFAILFGIIGARLYYVIFEWEQYKGDIMSILNIRNGGLAIYGGILGGIITCFVYSKIKKKSFLLILDTIAPGLLIGQILGRWGNFFNREAFGGYTDNLFAMQIKLDEVGGVISKSVEEHIKIVDGVEYIQVHPTFLYESMWNLMLLIIILVYRKYKKYDGDISAIYMIGYGIGRFLIEGLRTDQLQIGDTKIAVSQVVSIGMIVVGIVIVVSHIVKKHTKGDNGSLKKIQHE